jgi:hypothetical protein
MEQDEHHRFLRILPILSVVIWLFGVGPNDLRWSEDLDRRRGVASKELSGTSDKNA